MPNDPRVRRLVGHFKKAWKKVREERRNGGARVVLNPRVTIGVLDTAIERFQREEGLVATPFRSRGRTMVNIWVV